MGIILHGNIKTARVVLAVLCVFTISIVLQNSNNMKFTKGLQQQLEQMKERREPRLGDGCYNIYLDVGANVGVHGRFLFEPEKYQSSWHSVALFAREYGKVRDNRNYCVFDFEANSKHWPRLRQISDSYAQMGWRYHVIEAAVSDEEGNTPFFHQGTADKKSNEWGFSGATSFNQIGGWEVNVPTIRLSQWINHHIHERIVPEQTYNNATTRTTPILGMKMDIEGFEYVVMPDLIHSNSICKFDFFFGEFHSKFAPIRQFRENKDNGDTYHRVSLATKEETLLYEADLTKIMQTSRRCPVRWLAIDDESYLHDEQPLPNSMS